MAQIYVIVQFTSLILLVLSGPFLPESIATLVLYILSGIVGAFALASMRRSKLRVSPRVHPEATLITTGIYRFIRHPMYLAVILGALGMLVNQVTLLRGAIFLILIVDLVLKLMYEETILQKKFGAQYVNYVQNSKVLIPYLL